MIVSANPNAKVQAIGMDAAGRWQYRYSAKHVAEAAQKKFNRLKLFSKDMPDIRKTYEEGILESDARAMLLKLEDKTAIRIGSTTDFKAKVKAYGLTTLEKRHVKIVGNRIKLDFIAKEGLPAHYEITDSVLSKWLEGRMDGLAPGDMLFPDVSGARLNKYLKKIAGGKKYTIKDFRTYHGTRIAHEELMKYAGQELTVKERKKIIKEVSTEVSKFLHNTPGMAKKSYIDPMVWEIIGGLV